MQGTGEGPCFVSHALEYWWEHTVTHYRGVCDFLVLVQKGWPSSAAGGAGLPTRLSAL